MLFKSAILIPWLPLASKLVSEHVLPASFSLCSYTSSPCMVKVIAAGVNVPTKRHSEIEFLCLFKDLPQGAGVMCHRRNFLKMALFCLFQGFIM